MENSNECLTSTSLKLLTSWTWTETARHQWNFSKTNSAWWFSRCRTLKAGSLDPSPESLKSGSSNLTTWTLSMNSTLLSRWKRNQWTLTRESCTNPACSLKNKSTLNIQRRSIFKNYWTESRRLRRRRSKDNGLSLVLYVMLIVLSKLLCMFLLRSFLFDLINCTIHSVYRLMSSPNPLPFFIWLKRRSVSWPCISWSSQLKLSAFYRENHL